MKDSMFKCCLTFEGVVPCNSNLEMASLFKVAANFLHLEWLSNNFVGLELILRLKNGRC